MLNGLAFAKKNASFAEFFYDYTRDAPRGSARRALALMLLFESGLPYLRAKLAARFRVLRSRADGGEALSAAERLFCVLFPLVNLCVGFCNFALQARYLLVESAEHFSLKFRLLGQKLERRPQQQGAQGAAQYLKYAVPVLIPLLEWYYRSGAGARGGGAPGQPHAQQLIVKPPNLAQDRSQHSRFCQICFREISNPACLSTSGYVFCYVCITGHIRDKRACPVTKIESSEDQIIRIYTQGN